MTVKAAARAAHHRPTHNWSRASMDERGISYQAFRSLRPQLVMCSVTPFGLTGPYCDFRVEEITVAHGGGWAWLSPGASDRPDLPPLKAFGQIADFEGGLAAATAGLAALLRAHPYEKPVYDVWRIRS